MKIEFTTDNIKPGTYLAEVVSASETESKAGNPMIELCLNLEMGGGKKRVHYDRLTVAYPPKIKAFLEASGMLDQWEKKEIDARTCVGKVVKAVFEEARSNYAKEKGLLAELETYQSSGKPTPKPLDDIPF